jgi:hypothetical protein
LANHRLFPAKVRARAVELLLLGHLLARERPEFACAGRALIDVWVDHIMPHALHRDGW